ncbi:hypothetical protein ACNOYE_12950 [Nannocystaceae bacterium ST9]
MLVAILVFGPPQSNTYEQSRSELDAASRSITESEPADAIAALEPALQAMQMHPRELQSDPEAVAELTRARLALVWAHLAVGDDEAAANLMDEAIRGSANREMNLRGFGPALRQLHDRRRQALADLGTATIEVDCDGCEVLVDEARSLNPTNPLLLGRYRVWMIDPRGELEPVHAEVDLDQAGESVTLVFRAASERPALTLDVEPTWTTGPPEFAAVTHRPRETPGRERERKLAPRWAKLVSMGLGMGAMAAGSVLLALDGRCKKTLAIATRDNDTTCPLVLSSKAPGLALLGVGAGVFMGASVWLTVDEVHANQKRYVNAMVAWTLRF